MPIRIISLVVLFAVISISTPINAEDVYFIYPKKKPSVFKQINKKIFPAKKPTNNNNKSAKIDKGFTLPKEKPSKKEEKITTQEKIKVEEKKVLVKNVIDNKFVYPKKKPKSYKTVAKESKTSSVLSKKDFEKAVS